jgi:ParB-like chromosome segregation protein Spo0J
MVGFTISDVIEQWATEALRPHEANARIYGVERDEELIDSIREHGVLEALIVASDGTIIGGHRRWRSAVAAGLVDAPCRRIDGDDLALRRALVELNNQRIKTNQMIAHEVLELVAVAELEARHRMAEGGRRAAPGKPEEKGGASDAPPFDEASEERRGPRSREVVADAMGISARTVDAYVTVGRAIEALDTSAAADAPSRAAVLRTVLDERGPTPAAALARQYAAKDASLRQRAVHLLMHGDEDGKTVGETEVARRLKVSRLQVRDWHLMARIPADDVLLPRVAELHSTGTLVDAVGPQIGKSILAGRCYVWRAWEEGLIPGDMPAALKATGKPKKPKVKDYPTAGLVPAEQSVPIMTPTAKTGGAWAAFIMSVIEFLRMAAEADGEDIWRQWPEDSRERVADRMDAMAAELSRLARKIRAIRLTLVK